MVAIDKSWRLEGMVEDDGESFPILIDAFRMFEEVSPREFVEYVIGPLSEEEILMAAGYVQSLNPCRRTDEIEYYAEKAGLFHEQVSVEYG